jgi:Alw26I/Eco31I/Esp3I family type II restriction m6 adenine DNA methyltransferase
MIANPPYDVLNVTEGQKIPRRELAMIRQMPSYEVALGGKLNLYRLFFAKVFDLLNKSGLVTFIIPYGFMCDSSSKKLREFVLREKQIRFVEAFPERDDPNKRLFEAVKMSTCIVCVINSKLELFFPMRTHYSRNISFNVPTVHLDVGTIESFDPMNLSIPLMTDFDLRIVMKMLGGKTKRIGDIGRCYEGEINLTFHKKFLRRNKGSYAPMIKGAAIQRYLLLKQMSQGEIEFLDSSAFMRDNKSPKSKHHQLARVVMQGITGVNEEIRLKMTILDKGVFCGNSVNYILIKDNKYSEEYVLGILNSRLLNWYFKLFSTNSNVNGYEVDSLPIRIPKHGSEEVINLVDRILAVTKDEDYLTNPAKQASVKEYEHQIDQMVYQLYGLTPEEIAVVEGFNKK